jgi:hypothetical protein
LETGLQSTISWFIANREILLPLSAERKVA